MIRIKVIKPLKAITASKFQTGVRRGLQNSKQYLVGNKGNNSGLIKREMMQPKTGNTYVTSRKGKKKYHTASNSSGNESSAIFTGRLKNSISGLVTGSNRLIISANTPYARLQENGGISYSGYRPQDKGPYKVGPRNNLRRPIESSVGQIKNIIRREINKY
tara:strand:- start:38407 stop:38889 length:483 start_codon:yes stop_codon:yes gene_type:complete